LFSDSSQEESLRKINEKIRFCWEGFVFIRENERQLSNLKPTWPLGKDGGKWGCVNQLVYRNDSENITLYPCQEMASVSAGNILGKGKGLRKALWVAWSAANFGLPAKPHLDSRKDLLFVAFSRIKWIARKEERDRKTLWKVTVRTMDLIRKERVHEENWSLLKGRSILAMSVV
jgi:hypothetical protein